MKTIQVIFTMAVILLATAGFAAEKPQMYVNAAGEKKILVSVESEKALPFEIEITSDKGDLLYNWKLETPVESAQQIFDLSKMGQGEYCVTVNYGGNSVKRDVRIARKTIEVGKQVYMYEPFFAFKNDILKVSYLNLANNNVYLKVYKEGEYYAGVNLGKGTDIQKAIDFATAGKGEYNIVLSDRQNEHYFALSK